MSVTVCYDSVRYKVILVQLEYFLDLLSKRVHDHNTRINVFCACNTEYMLNIGACLFLHVLDQFCFFGGWKHKTVSPNSLRTKCNRNCKMYGSLCTCFHYMPDQCFACKNKHTFLFTPVFAHNCAHQFCVFMLKNNACFLQVKLKYTEIKQWLQDVPRSI